MGKEKECVFCGETKTAKRKKNLNFNKVLLKLNERESEEKERQ